MDTTASGSQGQRTQGSWFQRLTRPYEGEFAEVFATVERRLLIRFGLLFVFGLLLVVEELLNRR